MSYEKGKKKYNKITNILTDYLGSWLKASLPW